MNTSQDALVKEEIPVKFPKSQSRSSCNTQQLHVRKLPLWEGLQRHNFSQIGWNTEKGHRIVFLNGLFDKCTIPSPTLLGKIAANTCLDL